MTLRWSLVGSLVALLVGAGVAALVLALCSEGGSDSNVARRATATPFSGTVTVTRTPRARTPVTTGTPDGTPSPVTATPDGEPPPEDTPGAPSPPPPDESPPPGETPAPPPTQPAGTSTPLPATSTPRPVLPDLVLLDIFVSNDRLGIILGNRGDGQLPAGGQIQFRVRGVMADTVTLTRELLPGTSVSIVLENEVIYESGVVLAVVDPNNVIAEEDDNNNGIAKKLAPDVAPDLAVHGVFRSVETQRLLVVIRNPTDAPAAQATVVITVYLGGATEPTSKSTHQLSIEPLGFETVEIVGVAAVPGTEVRVTVEMTDPPDANPANNEMTVTIS